VFLTHDGRSSTGLVVGPDGTIFVVGVAGQGLFSETGYGGGASDGFILAIAQ